VTRSHVAEHQPGSDRQCSVTEQPRAQRRSVAEGGMGGSICPHGSEGRRASSYLVDPLVDPWNVSYTASSPRAWQSLADPLPTVATIKTGRWSTVMDGHQRAFVRPVPSVIESVETGHSVDELDQQRPDQGGCRPGQVSRTLPRRPGGKPFANAVELQYPISEQLASALRAEPQQSASGPRRRARFNACYASGSARRLRRRQRR
jgi:hypothetical protein